MIDRVMQDGAVTDFVRLSLGPVSTGIFNVSDVAIMMGVVVFALAREFDRPVTDEHPEAEFAEGAATKLSRP